MAESPTDSIPVDSIQDLISLLLQNWALTGPLALFAALYSIYQPLKENRNSCERWIHALESNKWGTMYERYLTFFLDWVDRQIADWPKASHQDASRFATAWPPSLLDITLRISLVYTILLIVLQWSIELRSVPIAHYGVLPNDVSPDTLFWTILFLFFTVSLIISKEIIANYINYQSLIIIIICAYIALGGIGFTVEGAQSPITGPLIASIAILLASHYSGLVTIIIVVTSVIIGVSLVQIIAGYLGVRIVNHEYAALIYASIAASLVATILIARKAGLSWNRYSQKLHYKALFDIGVILILLSFCIIIFIIIPVAQEDRKSEVAALFLIVCILPIINALSDYLSIGLTRYLLRRSLCDDRRFHGAEWIADIFTAVAIIIVLFLSVIYILPQIQSKQDYKIFELNGIAENFGGYWWLWISMLTTLIPTLIHVVFGLIGLIPRKTPWLRRWILERLRKSPAVCKDMGDPIMAEWGVRGLAFAMTMTIFLPIYGVIIVIPEIIGMLYWFGENTIGSHVNQ